MRLSLLTLLLAATLAHAAEPRLYVLTLATSADASPERRVLIEQFDRRLRAELRDRGATVLDKKDHRAAVVLAPRLDVSKRGLKLNLVGLRSADQKLLGSVTMKASGSSRDAQLRAIVTRAGLEAGLFE
ncbi:MAG: hypothetical protein Q8L48_23535 [Archangium sp.]|nr:hypothetical protein [Archangium sp.]